MDFRNLEELFLETSHSFKKVDIRWLNMGLSESEFMMLNIVGRYDTTDRDQPGIYVSQLADLLQVSPPAVSRMLRGLEKRGLLTRETDKRNRRNTFVKLTEDGCSEREKAVSRIKDFLNRVIQRAGIPETEQMLRQIARVREVMQEELEKEKQNADNIIKGDVMV